MCLRVIGPYSNGLPVVLLCPFRLAHVVQQDREIVVHFGVLRSQPQCLH